MCTGSAYFPNYVPEDEKMNRPISGINIYIYEASYCLLQYFKLPMVDETSRIWESEMSFEESG
jgi:hypothetical protein